MGLTLGMTVPAADFICEDDQGNRSITTARLQEYYVEWKKRDYSLKDSGPGGKETLLTRTTPYLKEANLIILELCRRFGNRELPHSQSQASSAISLQLLLSLQLVGSALTRARRIIYGPYLGTMQDKISYHYLWGHSKLMQVHMLELGWCPSVVATFGTKQPDAQCYAATLKAPKVKKDHSHCSERRCMGNQVDEEDYEVTHISRGCKCAFVGPVLEKVVSIIQNGGIPLLSLLADVLVVTDASICHESLDLVEYQYGMRYVAISHVWKDGLGNPLQNSIPSCQFDRLRRIVRELYADRRGAMTKFQDAETQNGNIRYPEELPPIWIDTLCVPVRGELQDVRTKAISSLRDVYKKSDKVIVIDEELQQISLDKISWNKPSSDRVEVLFRFAMSGWNSRLWTLQEGRLGDDVYLLLRDGILSAKDLFFRSAIDSDKLHNINEDAITLLSDMCMAHHDPSCPQELVLGGMVLGLRNRQTSRESDETICLTNMLLGDPAPLVNTECEQRMPTFLISLQGIPPGILFMGEPRSRELGFRWSPTSFLHRRDRCYDTPRFVIKHKYHPNPDRPAARLMDDGSGLQVTSPGIRLTRFETLPDSSQFKVDLSSSKSGPYYLTARYDRDVSVEDVSWGQTKAENSGRNAALVIGGWAMDYHDPVDCVLVALAPSQKDEGGCMQANVICSFQVFEIQGPRNVRDLEGEHSSVTIGTWYAHQQKWILD